jgi:hypothetical protein
LHDDTVSPKGDKEFCTSARDNLQQACPASDEGKTCRGKAKSIFNACYKGQSGSQTGSPGAANQATKTDRSTCMQTFIQQQQACQSRKLPPPSPGSYLAARISAIGVTIILMVLVTLMLASMLGADLFARMAYLRIYHHFLAATVAYLVRGLSWFVVVILLSLFFAVIYYFPPDVKISNWHWLRESVCG